MADSIGRGCHIRLKESVYRAGNSGWRNSMIYGPRRCGNCTHFPGNAAICKLDTMKTRKRVYFNDYSCENYKEGDNGKNPR